MKDKFNFNDIGKKIKTFTRWACWIGIVLVWIAAFISFCILISDEYLARLCWIPLLYAIVAPFVIWIGSWLTYAFGDMVDNIASLKKQFCTDTVEAVEKTATDDNKETEKAHAPVVKQIVCPNCSR